MVMREPKGKTRKNYQPAQESNSAYPNTIINPAEPPLTEISSLTEVDSTKMGRWSCVNLRGKQEKIVIVYSAYRVPQDSLPGPFTAYAQQYNHLQESDDPDPRPRRQFLVDLIKEIKAKQSTGNHQIILGIDANEILEPNGTKVKKTSITKLKRECGLTDVFEHQHELTGDISIKKNHNIDHLLVSEEVLPSVIRSGFLPWGVVIASDHRLGFIDINASLLFGELEDNTAASTRLLHTKYPKRTKKYREKVLEKFKNQSLFKAMRRLAKLAERRGRWSAKMQQKYETIDIKATGIIIKAEQNCIQKLRFHTSWSLPLMRSSRSIRYWNLSVTSGTRKSKIRSRFKRFHRNQGTNNSGEKSGQN